MSESLQKLLSQLKGVKPAGKGFVAKCPAHDDQHQSLSVGEGDDGRALLDCKLAATPKPS
jgi:putative DNA primase/helicase